MLTVLAFVGCEKEDVTPEKEPVYTERQEKVFGILKGDFQNIAKITGNLEIKSDILTFNKRFDEPFGVKGGSFMDGERIVFFAHGDGFCEDVLGEGSLSYHFYYSINEHGNGLKIYKKEDSYGLSVSPYKDCSLTIESEDKFVLRYSSVLPGAGIDTYYRIK